MKEQFVKLVRKMKEHTSSVIFKRAYTNWENVEHVLTDDNAKENFVSMAELVDKEAMVAARMSETNLQGAVELFATLNDDDQVLKHLIRHLNDHARIIKSRLVKKEKDDE